MKPSNPVFCLHRSLVASDCRRTRSRQALLGACALAAAALLGWPGGASGQTAGEDAEQSGSPVATVSTAAKPGAVSLPGTEVAVQESLAGLFEKGGTPDSIELLRNLEKQHQQVAARARRSTVSVRIGPAQGCGVIITKTGYVLTAAHVAMRPNKTAKVVLSNGRVVTAETLGMNRNVDAGLIRILPDQNDGDPWPHATLGSSDDLEVGMWCVATGHPGGFDRERGPVTRVGRILEIRDGAIVTDCALIGGDSGGPLFDMSGKLIAVHSRIGNDVAQNLHVPVDHYDESWDRLAARDAWGALPGFRPVLGVTGSTETDLARIIDVKPGSPAEAAGLRSQDIVEEFGDVDISDFASLRDAVADTMPGERIAVWIRRGDELIKVMVEIGRADEPNE